MGYPFHVPEERMSLEARILRVADIFQAMAQNRPYRAGLGPEQIQAFLQELVNKGKLDAQVVSVAMANLPAALQAATRSD